MPKKKWTTPQLIVLVRGGVGERLLVGCKGSVEGGPTSFDVGCFQWDARLGCTWCTTIDLS